MTRERRAQYTIEDVRDAFEDSKVRDLHEDNPNIREREWRIGVC